MTTFPATLLGSFGTAVTWSVNAVVSLKTAWERRRVVGQLASLDDHMLRDIGITRHDVMSVLAEPLYRDPSECLAERAADSRRARRAALQASHGYALRGSDAFQADTPGHRNAA